MLLSALKSLDLDHLESGKFITFGMSRQPWPARRVGRPGEVLSAMK
jgi:hypothetical protein